jgi:single-strand DNA-binding protein
MSYQNLILVGNLGRDPEMRYTPNGAPVTNFSIATNERWTDSDGEAQERTTWFRISAWGRLAEVTNEYLNKGRQVMVVGTLRADPETGGPKVFTRNDGTPGASFEVNARRVIFLGRGNGQAGAEDEVDDENIPF